MTIEGVDYSYDHPTVAELKAAGKKFACRYLTGTTSATPGSKNLTPKEADALQAGGIDIVSNYETTVGFMLEGYDSGARRAAAAWKQHKWCGGPDHRPIYFSLDLNATYDQWKQAREFLKGAASAIGGAQVGMYGGLFQVDWAHDELGMRWLWQALGWSYDQVSPHITLRQYRNGQKLGSGTVDYDRAMTADFGQWAAKEEDMPLTDEDVNKVATAVLNKLRGPDFMGARWDDTGGALTFTELLGKYEGTSLYKQLDAILAAAQADRTVSLDLSAASPQQLQDLGVAFAKALAVAGVSYAITGEAVPKATP